MLPCVLNVHVWHAPGRSPSRGLKPDTCLATSCKNRCNNQRASKHRHGQEVNAVEPVIRNFRSIYTPEGPAARLISLDDNPPTCTMSYSEIYPNKTSTHHTHPWEHEVYIIKGSGTLVCDGKEHPVREGDAVFIPGGVDHYTLNNGGQGVMRRIEINPLIAAQSGGPGAVSSTPRQPGKGAVPVIRNYRDLNAETGSRILNTRDGVPNYVMLYNGDM